MSTQGIFSAFRLALCCSVSVLSAGQAFGQELPAHDDVATVGDIIVTAQKRSERLSDVPISLTAATGEQLRSRLGPTTVVASSVNGVPGLWVGFQIERDNYWLQADPTRVEPMAAGTWFIWVGIALVATVLGSAIIARLINQPLKELSFAASRIREGEYDSVLDESMITREIREVNQGFNRMARELAKVEEDRKSVV